MLKRFIDDCNKMTVQHNEGKHRNYPHWKDHVLLPLAREIGTRLNMQYEVTGVFGLRFVCYIAVFDDDNRYILSTTPQFKPNNRETINRAVKYKKCHAMNEIERIMYDANGFGNEAQPLPDSVEDIIKIMMEKTVQ